MTIECYCGAMIFDISDYLSDKGHLVPDQEWFVTFDAIDDKVIVPLTVGAIREQDAFMYSPDILCDASRLMWQCRECGRFYIDDEKGNLHCYVPSDDATSKEILRSRQDVT